MSKIDEFSTLNKNIRYNETSLVYYVNEWRRIAEHHFSTKPDDSFEVENGVLIVDQAAAPLLVIKHDIVEVMNA